MKYHFAGWLLLTCMMLSPAFAQAECPLDSQPPILNNGTYALDKEKGHATESMTLSDGTDLRVEFGGCEYFTVTYKFTLPTPAKNIVGEEYTRAIERLTLLEKEPRFKIKPDWRADFSDAKKTLANYRDLMVDPKLEEALYIENRSEVQFTRQVWINGDLSDAPPRIEVTISSGPY